MNFNVFKRKKKKPERKAPEPKPEAPKPPPQEAAPPNGRPTPCIQPAGGANYYFMDELDRMSRVPGTRNIEVTTSRTVRWNLRDPVDGRDYEYYYQDQGPASMPHWGDMQRPPPSALPLTPPLPPPQYLQQHDPPGQLIESSHPYNDYGYGGAPSVFDYPGGSGGGGRCYSEDEHPQDCIVM